MLALVTVSSFVAALGAGSHYVAVGEEGLCFGVVELLAFAGDEFALVVELAEKLGCVLFMHLRGSAPVDVEMDAKRLETVFYDVVVLVHDVLGAASLLTRLDGDGHAVLVGTAHIKHLPPAHTKIADINVGGHIHSCKVPDVHRAVGVG